MKPEKRRPGRSGRRLPGGRGPGRAGHPGPDEPGPPTAPGASTTILVRPDWARLGGDLPGALDEVRFRGPHTDYHLTTPAGPLLIREAGPPRAAPGPASWTLLRARLMPGI